MTPWNVRAQQFILPKEGSTAEECEDAVAVNAGGLRFAAADGATEAFDARRWAERLAEAWAWAESSPLSAEEFRPWLAEQGAWLHASWEGRKLPWYAEEKRRAGSYAAFVGLRLEADARGMSWSAVALGDACLLQLRGEELLTAVPVGAHEAFGSCPPLVPSSGALAEAALARLVTAGGAAEPGDTFLLMTDALAAWYFEARARRSPAAAEFDSLLAAADNEALARLVRRERESKRMKDDDVAAVRIAVGAKAEG